MALIAERAADHLAARIVQRAAVEPRLGLGLEHPVGARIADREQVADRDVKPDPVVLAAGFEQQHAVLRVGREPVGQHAAGRARADDDVVVLAFDFARPRACPSSLSSVSLKPHWGPRDNMRQTALSAFDAVCRMVRMLARADGALRVRLSPERRFRRPSISRSNHGLVRPCAGRMESRHDCDDTVLLAPGCRWSGLPAAGAAAQDKTITVFAAASMKNALDDINAAFLKATGIKVVASYAASSALAKQIEQGAPADIFASADLDWMDYVGAEEAHQGRHARQPARQQAGADRAEGFQDRQRRPSVRASISPSSSATAASRPATCARCRSASTPRRRWRSSASGPRCENEVRDGGERARRAGAGGARRGACSASSTRPTPRSSRT